MCCCSLFFNSVIHPFFVRLHKRLSLSKRYSTVRGDKVRRDSSKNTAHPSSKKDPQSETIAQTSPKASVQHVEVTQKSDGQRLDNFLVTFLRGVPKSKIYRVIRKGEVRINKKRCKPESRVAEGDVVRIPPISVSAEKPKAFVGDQLKQLIESSIIFEDRDLLVVNKPSGIAVHGGSGVSVGLIEILRQRAGDHQFLELAHRLDRDTSGCILIAKKRSVLKGLHEQFREDRVNKVYHLGVFGKWPKHKHKVDAPLKKNDLKSGERFVVVHQEGKKSTTLFKCLRSNDKFSLVEAKPITGRTHQIRVHAAFSGFPIVGDSKYIPGHFSSYHGLEKSRLMLHAAMISFTMPNGQKAQFSAEYDQAFSLSLKQMSLRAGDD